MTKRMLIDATHAEETRVVVLDGNRLEDFDVETAAKKQLKGNIYLAKVVRVEPSLQAAFVEYGGGRHGFLAFGEIHPDYYQIPVADRQRLLELQEAEARAEEEADDAAAAADEAQGVRYTDAGDPSALDHDGSGHETIEHETVEHETLEHETVEHETVAHETIAREPPEHEAVGHDAIQHEQEPDHRPDDELAPELAPEPAAPAETRASEAGVAPEPPGEPEPPLPLEEPGRPSTQAAAMAQDFVTAREELAEAQHPAEAHAEPEPAASLIPAEEPDADPAPEAAPDSAPETPAPHDAVEPGAAALDDDRIIAHAAPPAEIASAGDDNPHEDDAHDDDAHDDDARDEDAHEARAPARFMRSYKIQEVIRRRQILLIQVVKEERGSKGAALTTYISLAGRFSVLMPNSPRGGGISRKITSSADRRRLKEVTSELQIPRGMGLIVRTAGANRPKAEIKRDCEYLLELWDSIRETTMASVAPALIHEEANLIKRAIRDNYSRDVDEVLVDGEAGWRAARDFMRMLMPAHARKVILWTDPQPLFARQQVEAQLDAMLVPTVQLKSGGYLVINQTEALVAIDVNSGRSTRERGIEETALKTNLEASDEVARQLRLRDLAGLIVIDFIDMESRRNNAAVEKRMKDALKDDRARIQLGGISHFGLMEMSRQRLRPSLAETSFTACPHCGGTGHVRSTETSALAVLRQIEDEGAKRRAAEIVVHVAGAIALYVLNHKRVRLAEIEARYGMTVAFAADDSLLPPETRIERVRAQLPGEGPPAAIPASVPIPISTRPVDDEDDVAEEEDFEAEEETAGPVRTGAGNGADHDDAPRPGETAEEAERSRKRRRRRRGGRRDEAGAPAIPAALQPGVDPAFAEQPELPIAASDTAPAGEPETPLDAAGEEEARSRRRGRRGGRRRRRDGPNGALPGAEAAPGATAEADEFAEEPASFDDTVQIRPSYIGPTPADPFGGGVFDIYDVMEQAEARAAAAPSAAAPSPYLAAPATPPPPPLAAVKRPEIEGELAEATVFPESAPSAPSAPAEEPVPHPEPAAVAPPTLELVPDPEPELVPDPEPEPEPASMATPEITQTPGPKPILIGAEDLAGEKKRGWWRR